jgi:hypothetical protein
MSTSLRIEVWPLFLRVRKIVVISSTFSTALILPPLEKRRWAAALRCERLNQVYSHFVCLVGDVHVSGRRWPGTAPGSWGRAKPARGLSLPDSGHMAGGSVLEKVPSQRSTRREGARRPSSLGFLCTLSARCRFLRSSLPSEKSRLSRTCCRP